MDLQTNGNLTQHTVAKKFVPRCLARLLVMLSKHCGLAQVGLHIFLAGPEL